MKPFLAFLAMGIVFPTGACSSSGSVDDAPREGDARDAASPCAEDGGCGKPDAANTDEQDPPPICGNGTVEDGETCDGDCPSECDDGDVCTSDTLLGSDGECTAACSHQSIVVCQDGDGCCPASCDESNDADCAVSCGNGVGWTGDPNDLPYQEIPTTEYTIDLNQWDIPNDGTDPEKTTANLQAAIDWAVAEGYGIVRLPAGQYMVGKHVNGAFQGGIELRSRMAFVLDDDATIEMAPNEIRNYYVVAITGQSHVFVSGGTILGDRYDHTYSDGSTHEGGICVAVTHESEHVTVENMRLGEATGDGVLLQGHGGQDSSVTNVNIRCNEMFDNRRQGISIVGGVNVLVEHNEIHHTKGTDPQFGIDIESEIYHSENILVRSNHFHHNAGGHIINFDAWGLVVENNVFEDGAGYEHWRSVIYYNNTAPTIRNNELSFLVPSKGSCIASYPNVSAKTNPDIAQVYGNTIRGCGVYMYEGNDLSIHDNHIIDGTLGLTEMDNVTLTDNRMEQVAECPGMDLEQVSGSAGVNYLNGEPFELPLTPDVPFTGRACDYL